MRQLPLLSLLVSTSVLAADYKACKEFFVSPLAGSVRASGSEATAPGKNAAKLELKATPPGKKAREVVIGPGVERTDSPVWNSLWVDKTSQGAWLALKAGDSLRLRLTGASGTSGKPLEYTVKVPQETLKNGVSFANATREEGSDAFSVRFSVTDGRRSCKGVKAVDPLVYALPEDRVMAKPDPELFAKVAQYNACAEKKTAACDVANYMATYADSNEDGLPDTSIVGGPFEAGKARILALALGFEPQKRQEIFVGACDELFAINPLLAACNLGDTLTLISMEKGKAGSRRMPDKERASFLRSRLATLKATEARFNLKSAYNAEQLYFAENNKYSDNAVAINFEFVTENGYAYFFAPHGVASTAAMDPEYTAQHPVINIIGPDTSKFPEARLPAGVQEAGCPVTPGKDDKGKPVGLGVSSGGEHFLLYAVGNLDEDADSDCWSISDVERTAKDGKTIRAGEPYHEHFDVEAEPLPHF